MTAGVWPVTEDHAEPPLGHGLAYSPPWVAGVLSWGANPVQEVRGHTGTSDVAFRVMVGIRTMRHWGRVPRLLRHRTAPTNVLLARCGRGAGAVRARCKLWAYM